MSPPTAPGSQSSAGDNAPGHMPSIYAHPSTSPFQRRQSPHHGSNAHSVSLPPLRQLSRTPPILPTDRRPGHPLGVHSMLNPQADLVDQQRSRRRSVSQMESPSPVSTQLSQSLPSISRPPSVDSAQDEPLQSRAFPPPGRLSGRHMLSPRSPSLHRTQSVGILGTPTGTIDAHQSPFLSAHSRSYGSEMVIPQPIVPTPPVGQRVAYFPQGLPAAPTPPPNLRRPSVNFPQSGTASPMASYSPYSQPASLASSQFETASQQASYLLTPNHTQVREFSNPPIAMETERSLSMQPSGQSTIQMMTIKNQQGHHVQIPVDVQAASKVADEKRKRNAGASARFRARRKEKEREASTTISRLEQQLRNAIEDAEYYKNERDYFKGVVLQQPGAEHHYATRPTSPRLRRRNSVAPSNAPSSRGGGGSVSSYSAYEDDNTGDSDRNVRRRTSSYHPVSGPAPGPSNTGSGPLPQAYSGQAPTGHAPHPSQRFDSLERRALPEMQPLGQQRPILRDPFASDAARFEDRSWELGLKQENQG
jgi:hypothetical protein